MEDLRTIAVWTGAFFVMIYFSGVWLRRSGKPYSGLKLNVHKFISLGALYYSGRAAIFLDHSVGLSSTARAISIVTAIFFVTTIITGGLVSIDMELPPWLPLLHKILPYLTVGGTILSLYLIFG